jgi:hypothetical protein
MQVDMVENDVVAKAIEIFIDSKVPPLWNGTITELLDLLTKIAQDNLKIKTSKHKDFSRKDFKSLPIEEQIEYSLRDSQLVMELSKHIPAESQNAILEQMSEFKNYKGSSKSFLRFAEWYLSNGKADPEHYHTVSFNNCLLRIPGSYNSKNMSQVSIIQKWDGNSKFLAYLIDQSSKIVNHHNNDNNKRTILSENTKYAYTMRKNSRLLKKKQHID